ncbi:MAG: periplasmic heavy metal sensor [Acidobacteriota bacterium]|nr:periplasmic heavy metal sensor [Acidobacteriota bacterium]
MTTLDEDFMKHNGQILTLVALILFAVSSAYGQVQQQPAPEQSQQTSQMGDPVPQLHLSPEQREKIRSIREQTKSERAAINERLRETNRALEEVLDTDNPDERLVEQRTRDVAAAQAASMRMRILTEVRIRRVLTMEQLAVLRTLRQQARQSGRNRVLTEGQQQRRQGIDGSGGLQNQRNGLGPLLPRRGLQRRPRP